VTYASQTEAAMPDNQEIMAALQRVEHKLDVLLQALADDGDDEPMPLTLDGLPAGAERQQGMSL